ncbi:hypothetical protein Hanom_Chr02g00151651 [Helianthus anomalus]
MGSVYFPGTHYQTLRFDARIPFPTSFLFVSQHKSFTRFIRFCMTQAII